MNELKYLVVTILMKSNIGGKNDVEN